MISSLSNEKIKNIAKLNEKKYRDQTGLFIVEGPHLVNEAKMLDLLEEVYSINGEGINVSIDVMKKICNTDTPTSIIGICRKLNKEEITNRILILDRIQDPGNMGTLIRSAVSFGFDTIVLSKGCVDIYNPKVVRSSQGALFKVNIIYADIIEFISKLEEYDVYGTSLVNGIPLQNIKPKEKMAIILGNEGQGIDKEILKNNKNIFIEMKNMESLNVSIAGSIIMYNLSVGK